MASTTLVAGRVSATDRARADEYIKSRGLTASDVIRIVWANIAATGEVPTPVAQAERGDSLKRRMRELRASTPRSEHLETLTPEALRRQLEGRDA